MYMIILRYIFELAHATYAQYFNIQMYERALILFRSLHMMQLPLYSLILLLLLLLLGGKTEADTTMDEAARTTACKMK